MTRIESQNASVEMVRDANPAGRKDRLRPAQSAALLAALLISVLGSPAFASEAPRPCSALWRGPPVRLTPNFPKSLRPVARRIVEIINCGNAQEFRSLAMNGQDLAEFWSTYARRGDIRLQAELAPPSGARTKGPEILLCDATQGMFCCRARQIGGRWRVGECDFNDGY